MMRKSPKGINITTPFLTTSLMILMFLITIAFTPNPNLQAQNIRYVATNGTDTANTCTNPDNPCRTIAHAIVVAVSGDIVDIADGIYTEPDGLLIDKSLTLQGAGQDNITIIQAHEEPGEATSRVITIEGGSLEVDITDLTIRHGNATGFGNSNGGGVYIDFSNNASLTNVTFSGNSAEGEGGGLWSDNVLQLTYVTFSGNSAEDSGGGLRTGADASSTLNYVTFSDNTAGFGGGMANGRSATLTNVTFRENHAVGTEANQGGGGGMHIFTNSSSPTLTDVTFIENTADRGGGIFIHGHNGGAPTLRNIRFEDNTAEVSGGGLYVQEPNLELVPELVNVTFTGNTASGPEQDDGGGGMFIESGSPTLTDVEFVENTADRGGGMRINGGEAELRNIHFQNNTAERYGGGMYNSSGGPTLINVVFIDNTATNNNGGGMYNSGSTGSPTLTNVTFSGNSANAGGGMFNDGGSYRLIWETPYSSLAEYENHLEETFATPEWEEWYAKFKPHIDSSQREILKQVIVSEDD